MEEIREDTSKCGFTMRRWTCSIVVLPYGFYRATMVIDTGVLVLHRVLQGEVLVYLHSDEDLLFLDDHFRIIPFTREMNV
jgi:hypothetical protein